jgi:hypothetical protein
MRTKRPASPRAARCVIAVAQEHLDVAEPLDDGLAVEEAEALVRQARSGLRRRDEPEHMLDADRAIARSHEAVNACAPTT